MQSSRTLDSAVFAEARARGLSPVLARIVAGRVGADTDLDVILEPRLANIPPPHHLIDMDQAVDRLVTAISGGEHIGILTDYDADGLTSHAVLSEALQRFSVDFLWRLHGSVIGSVTGLKKAMASVPCWSTACWMPRCGRHW